MWRNSQEIEDLVRFTEEIPSENVRKPKIFWSFQGVQKWNIELKWIKSKCFLFEWTIVTVFFWHYAKDNASKSAAKKLKFLYTLKLIPSCMQFLNRTLASTRHVVGFSCVQKLHKWECPFQKWWKNFQFLYIFFAFLPFFCLVLPIFEKLLPCLHTLEYAPI